MRPDQDALRRYLESPDLARLWQQVRRKLERLGRVGGEVRLAGASAAERRAVADLLGLPTVPRDGVRVPLEKLDQALRRSRFATDLTSAMTLVGGALRDLPAERRHDRARRQEIWEEAHVHPVMATAPALAGWLEGLARSGLLRRLAPGREQEVLDQALAVLAAVLPRQEPAAGGLARLAVVANGVLGSSHALDAGRPVATLALGALAHLRGTPPPRTAGERRELWEWAGVVADDLSCNVLVLGLAPEGGGALNEALRGLAALGEPAILTLRQLARSDLGLPRLRRVRVCENPAVVATAADRLGAGCQPLVCVAGIPNQAAWTLLLRLAGRGTEITYHGDFDWAGLRIANSLARLPAFRPWRFGAADYRAALPRSGERLPAGDAAVTASWDPDLAPAMVAAGLAVEEEAVVEDLLLDLAG